MSDVTTTNGTTASAPAAGVTNRIKGRGKSKDLMVPENEIRIAPLRQAIIMLPIHGTSPLKILRFSKKKQDAVAAKQREGSQSSSKKNRDPKDFKQEYEEAKYLCTQKIGGKKVTWLGLNASGVRNGCIECCRVAGYVMTRAKMSVFAEADGLDDLDATPLVRIYGEPEMSVDPVRNATGGIDLRPRVMFREWKMDLRIRFDEGQFSLSDLINLVIRVGQQNGLGEGRANGSNGNGTGNGFFDVNIDGINLKRLDPDPIVFKEKVK